MIDPAKIDALFDDQDFASAPGCAAVLIGGDTPLWSRCFGTARMGQDHPITPATRFRIASITKPMVALVIAALEDEGLLSLADPLSRHVPEHRFDGDPLLGHLLSMKSGLPETYPLVWLALGTAARLERDSRALLALLLAQERLCFRPGERTLYANANTIMLQVIAERVTGRSLGALLQHYVFEPASMAGAVLDDGLAQRLPGAAIAYTHGSDGFVAADPPAVEAAPGGVVASLDDMIAWHRWLRTNPRNWRDRLAAPVRHNDGTISGYAHGFVRQSLSGMQIVGHAGGHSGWASDYVYACDNDVAAIILGNRSDLNWYERCRELLVTALGLPPDPGATPALFGSAPEQRWRHNYASIDALCSITLKGSEHEIEVEGRRMPRGEDGSFRRTLGVEPFVFGASDSAAPPPSISRQEGNFRADFRLVEHPEPLDESLLIGSYTAPSLPHPVVIECDEDGVLGIATGPAWPSGERWRLIPVCGPLFRCHLPDGTPSEVHLRLERDADGTVSGISLGFQRIPRLFLRKAERASPNRWRELCATAPQLMDWKIA